MFQLQFLCGFSFMSWFDDKNNFMGQFQREILVKNYIKAMEFGGFLTLIVE